MRFLLIVGIALLDIPRRASAMSDSTSAGKVTDGRQEALGSFTEDYSSAQSSSDEDKGLSSLSRNLADDFFGGDPSVHDSGRSGGAFGRFFGAFDDKVFGSPFDRGAGSFGGSSSFEPETGASGGSNLFGEKTRPFKPSHESDQGKGSFGGSDVFEQGAGPHGESNSFKRGTGPFGESDNFKRGTVSFGESDTLKTVAGTFGESDSFERGTGSFGETDNFRRGTGSSGESHAFKQGTGPFGESSSFKRGTGSHGESGTFERGTGSFVGFGTLKPGTGFPFKQGTESFGDPHSFKQGTRFGGSSTLKQGTGLFGESFKQGTESFGDPHSFKRGTGFGGSSALKQGTGSFGESFKRGTGSFGDPHSFKRGTGFGGSGTFKRGKGSFGEPGTFQGGAGSLGESRPFKRGTESFADSFEDSSEFFGSSNGDDDIYDVTDGDEAEESHFFERDHFDGRKSESFSAGEFRGRPFGSDIYSADIDKGDIYDERGSDPFANEGHSGSFFRSENHESRDDIYGKKEVTDEDNGKRKTYNERTHFPSSSESGTYKGNSDGSYADEKVPRSISGSSDPSSFVNFSVGRFGSKTPN